MVVVAAITAVVGCGPGPTGPCANMPPVGCHGLDYVYTCHNGFLDENHCQRNSVCKAGACVPVVCKTGDFLCDGSTAVLCTDDGTVEQKDDCGVKAEVCVVEPLTAHCVAQGCTPMTTYCSGDEVRKCASDGLSYTVVQTCDDPDDRGRTCVGSSCLDRCQLTEARDRSTTGCNFLGVSGGTLGVVVGNLQPDLPATVTLSRSDGSLATTQTVAAGSTAQLSLGTSTIAGGTALGLGVRVTSTVPVMVWLRPSGDVGTLLHPNHTLSTSYVGVLGASRETVLVIADADSDVTVKVPVATDAGGTVAALAAGATLTQHLAAGQALALQASSQPLGGVRVDATTRVAVFVGDPSAASMPGIETWGRDYYLPHDAKMVSTVATVVTGPFGSIPLGAYQWNSTLVSGHFSAPVPFLVMQTGTVAPAAPQRRKILFAPQTGAAVLSGDTACTVTGSTGAVSVVTTGVGATYSGAIGVGGLSSTQPISGSTDLAGNRQLSFGYGLDVIP